MCLGVQREKLRALLASLWPLPHNCEMLGSEVRGWRHHIIDYVTLNNYYVDLLKQELQTWNYWHKWVFKIHSDLKIITKEQQRQCVEVATATPSPIIPEKIWGQGWTFECEQTGCKTWVSGSRPRGSVGVLPVSDASLLQLIQVIQLRQQHVQNSVDVLRVNHHFMQVCWTRERTKTHRITAWEDRLWTPHASMLCLQQQHQMVLLSSNSKEYKVHKANFYSGRICFFS